MDSGRRARRRVQAVSESSANAPVDSRPAKPFCDIVMKGGVASGLVYPPAVCELARTYRFRNIGGTSAGAIAAAATAAAEYGSRHGGSAFAELEGIHLWFGQKAPDGRTSNLLALFQPQPGTRALFRTLRPALQPGRYAALRVALAAVANFRKAALVGALPGLGLGLLASRAGEGALRAWSLVCAPALLLLGMAAALGMAIARRALRALPENFYGLTSGQAPPAAGRPDALTPWLHHTLNRLAGKPDDGAPLTFGELWGTADPEAERDVNLEMMATCLSHGRPYRLPLREDVFYFDPDELRRLFPDEVVRHMEDHPRAQSEHEREASRRFLPLRPLPAAADLPVVFATRLGLSFPLLIAAVPLHAVDFTRKVEGGERRPERCWFSDGGITSNFPVHFFDQPLPRWPTFAIDLRDKHPDHPPGAWMPSTNGSGIAEWWTRFEGARGEGSLSGFVAAIFNAMQNWMDNAQSRLPGYRDRVVHVSLAAREGGLNLDMQPEAIQALGERGRDAAALLVDHFRRPPDAHELSWDNHRWVRYRTALALLEGFLARLRHAVRAPAPDDRSYEELIVRGPADAPASYRWERRAQRDFAAAATRELLDLADRWNAAGQTFAEGAPAPHPELRIRPKV